MLRVNKLKFTVIVLAVALIAVGVKAYLLYQTISPNAISFWQKSNTSSKKVINHARWAEILSKYLSGDGNQGVRTFNYQGVTEADKVEMRLYLQHLQSIDPRDYHKNEQLAYWVNLYNALTIDIVLKHYPIKSIKDIGSSITGPWNITLANIAEQPLTLNQIEHGILRGLWQDKRIHYVINCASIGCPDLPLTPLTGQEVEQQLDSAAKRFINQSKGVNVVGKTLMLSSIYSWFSADFGHDEQQLIAHLKQYASPVLKKKLEKFNGVTEFNYNWKLNAVL